MRTLLFENPELFGHRFPHLDASIESAESNGNEVIVLHPWKCEGIDKLKSVYRHNNPNHPDFTFFNLSRWFLMRDWMESASVDVVFHMESDVLVFCKLEELWNQCKICTYATIPVGSAFVTYRGLVRITDWLQNTFESGQELSRSLIPGTSSDQRNIEWFLAQEKMPDLCNTAHGMIDENLYVVENEPAHENHKDIWFIDGKPYWKTRSGMWKMSTLHCWGEAKTQVTSIWEQSLRSINGNPVRLTINTPDYSI